MYVYVVTPDSCGPMLPALFVACTSLHRCLKMRIGRPVGATGELVRSVSRHAKGEFGVLEVCPPSGVVCAPFKGCIRVCV